MKRLGSMLLAGVIGPALAYFLDPERGRRRRNLARDRGTAAIRRGRRRAFGTARRGTAAAYGRVRSVLRWTRLGNSVEDDVTLGQRVASTIFRDPGIPKDRISINVERGTVVLRGEVERPEQIQAAGDAAWWVPGVHDVDNRLHLPGVSAP